MAKLTGNEFLGKFVLSDGVSSKLNDNKECVYSPPGKLTLVYWLNKLGIQETKEPQGVQVVENKVNDQKYA